MMDALKPFLLGAIAMGSFVAALFFLRFWIRTGDRFFLLFSGAFMIESGSRMVLAYEIKPDENEPLYYLPRLLAFGLIALAVMLKNRPRGP